MASAAGVQVSAMPSTGGINHASLPAAALPLEALNAAGLPTAACMHDGDGGGPKRLEPQPTLNMLVSDETWPWVADHVRAKQLQQVPTRAHQLLPSASTRGGGPSRHRRGDQT